MNKLHHLLNKEVSNFAILFTKLHHFHWYVKGANFFALHEKFESLYDEVNELYDEFAERLLAIGGLPISTQKGYLEAASIAEATGLENTHDMVLSLKNDLNLLIDELKEGIVIAQENDDESTADLFISTITTFQKHVWMLHFYLS